MNLNFSKETEQEFQEDLSEAKRRAARNVSIVAAAIYFTFSIVDIFMMRPASVSVWMIRFSIISFSLSVAYLTKYRADTFVKKYNFIIIMEYLVWGLGTEGIAIFSPPDHMAWHNYHPALILITFALYTTTYLNLFPSLITGLILVFSYIATAILFQGVSEVNNKSHIISNIIFLLSTNAVAFISKNIMVNFSRSAFVLKKDLLDDIEKRKALEEKLREMATKDKLTGIYNRWRFMEIAEHEFKRHKRSKKNLCIIMLDLDFFKNINDTHGHAAGDLLLQSFSGTCTEYLRESDMIGRYGGEEFIILLPETPLDEGYDIAERIRNAFERNILIHNSCIIRATVSMGLAEKNFEDMNIEQIISRADLALYEAKRSGRNAVRIEEKTNISNNNFLTSF